MKATLTNILLSRLMERRAAVQKQLDDVLSSPQSYSIQGSYSQTAQSAETLRAELAKLDGAIQAAISGFDGGIKRMYPVFRDPQ
ncbi:MAG: hypothetical protein ACI4SG_00680 [Oligosphaeraceae bacterium]